MGGPLPVLSAAKKATVSWDFMIQASVFVKLYNFPHCHFSSWNFVNESWYICLILSYWFELVLYPIPKHPATWYGDLLIQLKLFASVLHYGLCLLARIFFKYYCLPSDILGGFCINVNEKCLMDRRHAHSSVVWLFICLFSSTVESI